MTTTYQRINQRAEAEKQRKQESYEDYVKSLNGGEFHPLSTRVYRQDEKITSQFATKNQTSSSHDEIGSVEGGLSTLDTERSALKAAGGKPFVYNTDPQPLIDLPLKPYRGVPNKYIGRKYCVSCEAWKLKSEFTPRNGMVDGCHSYCRDCRNKKRRKNPDVRWKRG